MNAENGIKTNEYIFSLADYLKIYHKNLILDQILHINLKFNPLMIG
tara:strand:+ start:148757 stop:148894 length:138 start_codon:yes stop_codon:yes gene_type:complete